VGDLFTVEFFLAAARHLKPDGIMSAWLQIYQMGDEEFRSALKTFASVFPYSMVWIVNEGDVIMIGSFDPIRINGTFVEKMKEPSVRADLARTGVNEPSDILSMLWLGDEDLGSYAGKVSRVNTDDNMLLEFGTGRRLVEATLAMHMSDFVRTLAPRYFGDIDSVINEKTRRQVTARCIAMTGVISEAQGDLSKATDLYDTAYFHAPTDPFVASKYAKAHLDLGLSVLKGGRYDVAMEHFRKARGDGNLSASWAAYHGLGLCYYYKRDYQEARENLGRGLELNPHNAAGYLYLGMTLMALGDTLQAIADYEKAFELRSSDAGMASALARVYATAGVNLERALELARTASRSSHAAEYYDTLGLVYLKKGDLDRAESSLRDALRITPQHVGSAYHLALVSHARGEDEQAETLLGQVLRADPGGPFAASAEALLHEIRDK
jgi:tetratricopeptide (TPR) repeat protein